MKRNRTNPERVRREREECAAIINEIIFRYLHLQQESGEEAASAQVMLRKLADTALWAYSEAEGKYLGCRWWTQDALRVYQNVAGESSDHWSKRLNHDHPCGRANMLNFLLDPSNGFGNPEEGLAKTKAFLEAFCVGVVVTKDEHRLLTQDRTDEQVIAIFGLGYGRWDPEAWKELMLDIQVCDGPKVLSE